MLASTAQETVRIGAESTSARGTQVNAGKLLRGLNIRFTPDITVSKDGTQNGRFDEGSLISKEMARGNYEGQVLPDSLIYILSSYLQKNPQAYALVTTNTSSNFTVTYNAVTSGNIAGNSTAAAIQTVLEGLSSIGSGNAIVFGTAPNFTILLRDTLRFQWSALTATGAGLVSLGKTNGWKPDYAGSYVQVSAGTASSLTLTFRGQNTAGLTGNSNAATIQSALEALTTIGTGNVLVENTSANTFRITFRRALTGTPHALTGTGTGLTSLTVPAITNLRIWEFVPFNDGEHIPQSYSIERGRNGANNAYRSTFLMFQSLNLMFGRSETKLSGNVFAQAIVDPATFTVEQPTEVARRVVHPRNTAIYLGSTVLGMTNIADAEGTGVEMEFQSSYDPDINLTDEDDLPGFTELIEKPYDPVIRISVPRGSNSQSYLSTLRAGSRMYFLLETKGANIDSSATAYRYRVRFLAAVDITHIEYADSEEKEVSKVELSIKRDSTLGGAYTFTVWSALTAL